MTAARWSLARWLRWRLLFAVAVLWALASLVAVVSVRAEMNEVLDSAVLALAEQIPIDAAALSVAPPPSVHDIEEDVMHVLVRDAQGRVLRRVGTTQNVPWPLDAASGLQTLNGWRVATRRAPDTGIVVQVGESLRDRREALTESTAAMALSLLALLPIAALLIDLLLRRSFKSAHNAAEQWRARHEADFTPLQAGDLPTEFEPMVGAINNLVERMQGMVRAERAFAASTAHELRTPLAAARAQAQRLLAELPEEPQTHDARERAQALVRSLDRLGNTATKLLQLSRVESGVGLTREAVDLRQLATLILDEFRHHADAMHRLRVQLPEAPVVVQGDLDALGIAMRNLIENALKHAPQAQVELRIEAPGRVIVTDDGPGVAPATLGTLSQPYSRGDARADGTGLGLAIVAKIAEQQQARLALESPPEGLAHGFRATLTLGPSGGPVSSRA